MSRRFSPPPLAGFYVTADADHSRALAEARQEGFAEGHALGMREGQTAGFAEGAAETEAAQRLELDALRESSAKWERHGSVIIALRQVLAARDEDLESLDSAVRMAAAAALQTLFPTLAAHAIGAEIAALLAAAMTERAPEVLTLRAHPDTLAAVAIETGTQREAGRLVFAPSADMESGAAEIGWTGGGITFDPAALLAHVTSVLVVSSKSQPSEAIP